MGDRIKRSLIPAIVFVSAAAVWLVIRLVSGFNGLYGQDSHEYLRFTKQIIGFITTGQKPGAYYWPVGYPLLGAILSRNGLNPILSLQIISFLSWQGSGLFIYRVLEAINISNNYKTHLSFSLLYLFTPAMFRASFLDMSDMLATFLLTGSFFFFVRFNHTARWYDLALVFFCAGYAVLTRYASLLLVLPILIILIRQNWQKIYLWGISVGVFALLALFHLTLKENYYQGLLDHPWLRNWSIIHFFQNTFDTPDGHFDYHLINAIYSLSIFFHPLFFPPLIFLSAFYKIKFFPVLLNKVAFISLALYVFFLAGIPYQNIRFLIITFPLAILLISPLYNRFFGTMARLSIPIFLFIMTVQLIVWSHYSLPLYNLNRLEQNISATLKEKPPKTIYTFAMDGALHSYCVPDTIVNLWDNKIAAFKKGSYVLFNASAFAKQWHDKNPMFNWQLLKNHYSLDTLKTFEKGWQLYEIH